MKKLLTTTIALIALTSTSFAQSVEKCSTAWNGKYSELTLKIEGDKADGGYFEIHEYEGTGTAGYPILHPHQQGSQPVDLKKDNTIKLKQGCLYHFFAKSDKTNKYSELVFLADKVYNKYERTWNPGIYK